MIKDRFIKSPEYQDYLDNKDQISEESLVFVEDKERLITQEHEYQFVPNNGNPGQALVRTEDGVEFKDLDISTGWKRVLNKYTIRITGKDGLYQDFDIYKNEITKKFIDRLPITCSLSTIHDGRGSFNGVSVYIDNATTQLPDFSSSWFSENSGWNYGIIVKNSLYQGRIEIVFGCVASVEGVEIGNTPENLDIYKMRDLWTEMGYGESGNIAIISLIE